MGNVPWIIAILLTVGLLLAAAGAAAFFYFDSTAKSVEISGLKTTQTNIEGELSQSNQRYSSLKSNFDSQSDELSKARADITSLQGRLNITQSRLNASENELSDTKSELAQNKEQLKTEIADMRYELDTMQSNINDSMAWFRTNAELPKNYAWNVDVFEERTIKDCVDKENELNLACIAYLLETTAVNLRYKDDMDTSNRSDYMQSVKDTLKNAGGDCEDYSIFMKATLNTIREQKSGLSLVGFGDGKDWFIVYPTVDGWTDDTTCQTDGCYYYSNSRKVALGSVDKSKYYVVCFDVDESSGHCALASSEFDIRTNADIPKLYGSPVFEPQTGEYLGTIGQEYPLCDPSTMDDCEGTPDTVYIVISDYDLFQVTDGEWQNYAGALDKTNAAQSALDAFENSTN